MSSLAQEESRSISENVTWGKRKHFADGKYEVAFSTFWGYEKGNGDERFVINEEQAMVVRLIYALFLPPQRDSNKDYHGITCEKHEYLAKKPKILRIEPTSSQKTMNRTIKTMHQIALVFALGSCIKNA